MQPTSPTPGRLFPDNPQPQNGPRFASNVQQPLQPYEPQPRMQQTGSIPVIPVSPYTTGSLRPLHGGQPVSSMPPMATMPTAQAYQQATQPTVQEAPVVGTPLMVHTIQGTPVLVTREEMERTLGESAGKKKRARHKKAEEKGAGKSRKKVSLFWFVFGVIGILFLLYHLLESVGIPLLVFLHDVTGGAL